MSANTQAKILVSCVGLGLSLGFFGVAADAAPPASAPAAGGQMGEILAKLDALNAKLDRVEKRLGCPIDEYVAGTCTDSPAGISVTYCISQGRSGELAGKWAVEPKAKVEVGGSWDVALLGRLEGDVSFPLFTPLPLPPIPIPTELAVAGSASLGRGFDICVEIPLQVAAADATILDSIVRGMNPSTLDTKYQRRLTRLLNYANRRVPEPVTSTSVKSAALAADDFDLDVLDDAMERFNAGAFQQPDGPLGLFKDPVIQDLRNTLELPEPVQIVLDDPDLLFESMPTASAANPAQLCDKLKLSGAIANRAPAITNLCSLLGSMPSFDVASRAFGTVHQINTLLADLPDEIIFGVADILPDVNTPKLPAPRPPGSTVCNIFPRLCR